ncbi:glutathione S-transferase family protein [Marilutibacter aestuarii]|uniref:Glutathione S-transferase family protein n=1 Tax=Marilutibacter aestuarii TaxID=1706195 RepID=A0A507ZZE3_9GAMM|nr:glutathione S-transferase family protein [Lysobacter aestuarii]TQD41951.1 glutathione S-transferase family protein [Lysobacter aestuarii]
MTLQLYAHPFSSYCQKALVALYENATPFEFRMLSPEHPSNVREFEALWPIRRFPLLRDGARVVQEATIIIEYLQLHHPGPVALLPDDAGLALEARRLDRFFDNYVSTPQQKLVFDCMRAESDRDPMGVADARRMLETAYRWLDGELEGREWATGDRFTLADCAAAPALFYADWSHPIDPAFERVHAYRRRLLARPSFARAVDEARPYRPLFPLGAPDRD